MKQEYNIGDYRIAKQAYRTAYSRNGNFHNPTVYYRWELWKCGKLIETFTRLRAAKAAIGESK